MEEDRANLDNNMQQPRRDWVYRRDHPRKLVEHPNLHTIGASGISARTVHTEILARVKAIERYSAFLDADEARASSSKGFIKKDHPCTGAAVLFGLRLLELRGVKRTDIRLDKLNCIQFKVVTGFLVLKGFFRQHPATNCGLFALKAAVKTTAWHEGACIGREKKTFQPPPVITLFEGPPTVPFFAGICVALVASTTIASEVA